MKRTMFALMLILSFVVSIDSIKAKELSDDQVEEKRVDENEINKMADAFNRVDNVTPEKQIIDGEEVLVRTITTEEGLIVKLIEKDSVSKSRISLSRYNREYFYGNMHFEISVLVRLNVLGTSRTDVEVTEVTAFEYDPFFGSVVTSHSTGMLSGGAWAAAYFDMSLPWDNRYMNAYASFDQSGWMSINWTASSWDL